MRLRVQQQGKKAHSQGFCQQELDAGLCRLLVLVMSDSWDQALGLGTVLELAGISGDLIPEEVGDYSN